MDVKTKLSALNAFKDAGNNNKSFLKRMKSAKGKMMNKIGVSDTLYDSDDEEDTPAVTSSYQRSNLISRYGVSMELPAFYYYNAQFVPHLTNCLVTMAFHIIPQG